MRKLGVSVHLLDSTHKLVVLFMSDPFSDPFCRSNTTTALWCTHICEEVMLRNYARVSTYRTPTLRPNSCIHRTAHADTKRASILTPTLTHSSVNQGTISYTCLMLTYQLVPVPSHSTYVHSIFWEKGKNSQTQKLGCELRNLIN